jgi:hydrogenase maturation factor
VPCAETLVKRGVISKNEFKHLLDQLKKGKEPGRNKENIFKIAIANLKFISIKKNENEISDDTIREYFLFKHDKVVDDRFELMRDFDADKCKTYSGIVRKIRNNNAKVETLLGINSYKTYFVKNLKVDDIVVVHRDFIIEKIPKQTAIKMWKLKEKQKKHIFD